MTDAWIRKAKEEIALYEMFSDLDGWVACGEDPIGMERKFKFPDGEAAKVNIWYYADTGIII